jgi:hypothetical protein
MFDELGMLLWQGEERKKLYDKDGNSKNDFATKQKGKGKQSLAQ